MWFCGMYDTNEGQPTVDHAEADSRATEPQVEVQALQEV